MDQSYAESDAQFELQEASVPMFLAKCPTEVFMKT
jgi:hypothetical protein